MHVVNATVHIVCVREPVFAHILPHTFTLNLKIIMNNNSGGGTNIGERERKSARGGWGETFEWRALCNEI